MPINNITAVVPATGQELSTAWAYASTANFDFENKTARLVYTFYATKAGAYSGLPPLRTVEIRLGAETTPAMTVTTLVTPGIPAVLDEEGNETTPSVDPVYDTATVYPALPSLPSLISDNFDTYKNLCSVLDTLAASLPEFVGGAVEDATT